MTTQDSAGRAAVLVTGANGFLGRELVARLCDTGERVRAFVLPGEPVPAQWAGRVDVVRGDVTDRVTFSAAAQGVQKIFHLAAIVTDSGADDLHQRVTVGGTRIACEIAVDVGAQLLLASSVATYGDRIGRGMCSESTPHGNAMGPYSRAKQDQEKCVREFERTRGLNAVIMRPANIYGAGSKPWLHDVAVELKRGMPVLVGGGDFDGGLVHVANVASLFVAAANTPAAQGEILLASDGEGITWKQYFTDLAALLGAASPRSSPRWLIGALAGPLEWTWQALGLRGRPPITREAFNLVANANRYDNTRTRALTGWRPAVTYARGMEEIARYIREGNVG